MQKTVFTTGEAAKICKVSQQTIIRCFDSGQLRGFRVPGSRFRRIPRDILFRFMKDNGIPTDALESGKRKVLLVDDDPEILRFITRCLEAEGFATDCCGTGEAAVERAKSGAYWLVLLDIAMPGMDGWETCQRIRTLPNLGGVRVYMVTAKPMDRSLNKVRESGAAGYLMKPFKAEDLRALVEGYEWRKIEMR